MSDLVICKFRKNLVIHDIECPYRDQVSLNNTNHLLMVLASKVQFWLCLGSLKKHYFCLNYCFSMPGSPHLCPNFAHLLGLCTHGLQESKWWLSMFIATLFFLSSQILAQINLNSWSAKYLKIHLEMGSVDLWHLLYPETFMARHGGSSACTYLANYTSSIPYHSTVNSVIILFKSVQCINCRD